MVNVELFVDHDANWVARKFASQTGGPVKPMISLAKLFLVGGCDVHIYGDGEERHHSKKATIERDAKSEQARLDSIGLRKHLLSLVERSQSPGITQAEKAELVVQIKKVEKTVVSKENIVRQRVLHAGFFEELCEQVEKLRDSLAAVVGCGEIIIKQAATQADSVICWRSINSMSDAAIANDSDFPVVAGAKMMLIRNWNGAILGKTPTLTNLELATSSLGPLKQAAKQVLLLSEL